MKYIILLLIIIGLSTCDLLINIIKQNPVSVKSGMQKKICDWLIMGAACGLGMGVELLGQYYQCTKLSDIISTCIAGIIFWRIMITNIISILESYAELNTNASWIKKIITKLRNLES